MPTEPASRKFAAQVSAGQHAMIEFKGSHFERDVILWAVRWYVAYPISYRQLEEMMAEHGVEVDHATLNRWVVKYVPLLEREFRTRKLPVGSSWRMDETYVRVKGSWKYLYRAVDKAGATVDFLLTAKRDRKAALRFLRKAINGNGTPEKITIDKSGANTAAIESHNAETEAGIEIRQIKYLNNIVEQDHRAIKRLIRPMLGFKSFRWFWCKFAPTTAALEPKSFHYAASTAIQTAGMALSFRRNGRRLNWPLWIRRNNSTPAMVISAVLNPSQPSIGNNRDFMP